MAINWGRFVEKGKSMIEIGTAIVVIVRSADAISRERFEECIEECNFLVISCKTTKGINVKKKCQILKVAAKIERRFPSLRYSVRILL